MGPLPIRWIILENLAIVESKLVEGDGNTERKTYPGVTLSTQEFRVDTAGNKPSLRGE
jgi:uncharacterized protein YfaT (DUF1175 family)